MSCRTATSCAPMYTVRRFLPFVSFVLMPVLVSRASCRLTASVPAIGLKSSTVEGDRLGDAGARADERAGKRPVCRGAGVEIAVDLAQLRNRRPTPDPQRLDLRYGVERHMAVTHRPAAEAHEGAMRALFAVFGAMSAASTSSSMSPPQSSMTP